VKDTLDLFSDLIDFDIHPIAGLPKMQDRGLPGVGNNVDADLAAVGVIGNSVDGEAHTIASN
jgi:hypothetical protein